MPWKGLTCWQTWSMGSIYRFGSLFPNSGFSHIESVHQEVSSEVDHISPYDREYLVPDVILALWSVKQTIILGLCVVLESTMIIFRGPKCDNPFVLFGVSMKKGYHTTCWNWNSLETILVEIRIFGLLRTFQIVVPHGVRIRRTLHCVHLCTNVGSIGQSTEYVLDLYVH